MSHLSHCYYCQPPVSPDGLPMYPGGLRLSPGGLHAIRATVHHVSYDPVTPELLLTSKESS